MGVGKTSVCRRLKHELPNCVFLDGDWCWDASPFQVTEETKAMVMDNICYLLNHFLHCPAYENIVFCWVLHKQPILDELMGRLDTEGCNVTCVSLLAEEAALRSRLAADIDRGIRTEDVIGRSVRRLPMYQTLDTIKIDTTGKTVAEISDAIKALTDCDGGGNYGEKRQDLTCRFSAPKTPLLISRPQAVYKKYRSQPVTGTSCMVTPLL